MVGCCRTSSASAAPAPNEGLRDFLFPPNQLRAVSPLPSVRVPLETQRNKHCFLLPASSGAQFDLQQGFMLRAAAIG